MLLAGYELMKKQLNCFFTMIIAHVKTKFKKPKEGEYCFCFALLFNDADTNKQYAMKGNREEKNIITEVRNWIIFSDLAFINSLIH